MAAFKNKDNGTWYVQFRYTDWKGERQQKLKRGFATKREALEWERSLFGECGESRDRKEGMMAFLEKRPRVFTGE